MSALADLNVKVLGDVSFNFSGVKRQREKEGHGRVYLYIYISNITCSYLQFATFFAEALEVEIAPSFSVVRGQ